MVLYESKTMLSVWKEKEVQLRTWIFNEEIRILMSCQTCTKVGFMTIRYDNFREYRFCDDCGDGSFTRKYPTK